MESHMKTMEAVLRQFTAAVNYKKLALDLGLGDNAERARGRWRALKAKLDETNTGEDASDGAVETPKKVTKTPKTPKTPKSDKKASPTKKRKVQEVEAEVEEADEEDEEFGVKGNDFAEA